LAPVAGDGKEKDQRSISQACRHAFKVDALSGRQEDILNVWEKMYRLGQKRQSYGCGKKQAADE
jgi:hypothetical protein